MTPAPRRRRPALEVVRLEDRTVPSGSGGDSGAGLDAQPPAQSFFQPGGFLTGPQPGDRDAVARATLAAYAGRAGLTAADVATAAVTSSYSDLGQGHVYFRQAVNGLPVVNTAAGVHLMDDGRTLVVYVAFVPDVAATADPVPVVGAAAAVARAAAAFGYTLTTPPAVLKVEGGARQTVVLSEPEFSDQDIRAERGFVNTARGVRPVWELVARTPDGLHWYDATVDTQDGAVEFWSDWVDALDTYNAIPIPNESPIDGGRAVLVNPADPAQSPYGWHDTNGAPGGEFTDTRGNNVSAQLDLTNTNPTIATATSGGNRPDGGANRIFDNPYNVAQAPNLAAQQPALVTNLFVMNNVLHDVHAAFGFTAAAGNFQLNNYGQGGLANDQVNADAQDGSGTNNANFATPADGTAPRMQMYRFTSTNPNRDSDFDNDVIIHEFGHGVSNRLTGGPANSNALNATQSGGMGEGWSDWWAMMFLQRPTDQQTDAFPAGVYVTGSAGGIRRFPYSFNMTTDPLTYDAYGSSGTTAYGVARSFEVHDAGEIWASTLWDMNWLLINKYGYDQDLTTGYAPGGGPASAGNKLALRLVMDALKIQAVNPSFVDARDAILMADVALTGGANQREIWTAFARRGLGAGITTLSSGSTANITGSFALPATYDAAPGVIAQTPTGLTATAPSSVTVTFSEPMQAGSFNVAADVASFTGPGGANLLGAITGFTWISSTKLQINFTPQAAQGLYSLVLGPNVLAVDNSAAMDQDLDGVPGEAAQDQYAASFRYDAAPLTVTAITPATGASLTGTVTAVDVTFSEAVAPGSVVPADLNLSVGTATGVTLLSATQVRFTVAGVGEGTTYLSLKYGAVTDAAGFPSLAFNSSFSVDFATVAFPTPLASAPLGSLVYDGTFPVPTQVGVVADTDSFTITLDAGQRLSAVVTPAGAALVGVVAIFDPANALVGGATGTAGAAVTATAAAATAGTYTVRVAGNGSTTGFYGLRLLLNAAGEGEQYGGAANDTTAAAQPLDPLLTAPATGLAVASVVGVAGVNRAEAEANGTTATANDLTAAFAPTPGSSVYTLNWTGAVTAGDGDYTNLGTFQAGDILTISLAGSGGGAGTLGDCYVELRDSTDTIVAESDDDGPGTDSLIQRFTIPTAGTYYVKARGFGASDTGTYRVGVRLENAGAAPTTGGAFAAETEANNTLATANNGAGAWRQAAYRAVVAGTITAADTDVFKYALTAGDRVTLRAVGAAGFLPTVALLNAAGTALQTMDGSASEESSVYGYVIPSTGTYYARVTASSGTGGYTLEALLAGTAPPAAAASPDVFSVVLAAGDVLTAGLAGGPTTTVEILDPSGTPVATGTTAGNYTATATATAAAAGTYFVRVADAYPTPYQLTVARGGTLDPEPNNTPAAAGPLAFGGQALGGLTAGDEDWYAVTIAAGNPGIRVRTFTPGDAAGEFVNALDPRVEIYSPSGTLLAGDDNSSADGRNATAAAATPAAGVYKVRVLTAGGTAGEYVVVTDQLPNLPPTGVSAGGPYSVTEGTGVTLAATATDPEGDPITYSWDVNGDGTFGDATGPAPSLTWAQLVALGITDGPATFAPKVRATDGFSSPVPSPAATLTVVNAPPTGGTASNSGPVDEGGLTPVTVTVTGVTDPSPADAAFTYRYDFDNDGTYDLTTASASVVVPAAYVTEGPQSRVIGIQVSDKDGGAATLSTTVVVRGVAPTGTLAAAGDVNEGSAGSVTVTGVSDPSPGDTAAGIRYSFDFDSNGTFDLGNGTYAGSVGTTTVAVPAQYLADGNATRTVKVRVLDRDGLWTESTATIRVLNVAPTAPLTGGGTVPEGSTTTLQFGAVTDPSPADALAGFRYAFDTNGDGVFDVGGTTYAAAVTNPAATIPPALLADSGSYTLRARVYDKDGDFTEKTVVLVVQNVAPTGAFVGGTAPEGSPGSVAFQAVADPSLADTAAGFRYAYDFDNDGTFEVGGTTYAASVTSATAVVPASYLPDGPLGHVVHGRVYDKDGGFTDYLATAVTTNVAPTASLAGATVDEGGTAAVAFGPVTDPSAVDVAAGFRYAFDFNNDGTFDLGDGTYAGSSAAAAPAVPAALLADSGTYTVRAWVIDRDEGHTEYTATLTVRNVAPTAVLTGGNVPEGSAAVVSFGSIVEPSPVDRASLRFAYDFDNDGVFDLGGSTYATGVTDAAPPLPASIGANGPNGTTVRARIYDKDGGVNEYTTTVTVQNVAPTATLADLTVDEGGAAAVALTNVFDPSAADLAAVRYSFDLDGDGTFDVGDGTYAGGVTTLTAALPAALLADGGAVRTVNARVLDPDGGATDYAARVTVRNVAPTAAFAAPGGPVGADTVLTFTSPVDVPADAAAGFTYSFDFVTPTGTVTRTGTTPTAVFRFADPGTYAVRGRITDKDGGVTEYPLTVTVANVAPAGTPVASPTTEGGTAAVAVVGASHPGARATAAGLRYSYDFDGDGTFDQGDGTYAGSVTDATAAVPPQLLTDSGTLPVTVRVIEVNGAFADLTAAVAVANVAPTATLTVPADTVAPRATARLTLDGVTDPSPADTTAGFRYDLSVTGPGFVYAGQTATALVTFPRAGVYTVTGTVTDKDGGATTRTATVTVLPTVPLAGYAVGADAGGAPRAILYGPRGTVLFDGLVFDPAFTGGVRVATGDVNGDGVIDLIAGTGPGAPTRVRVISGRGGDLLDFAPFEASFTGGVYVAAGDADGDGAAEVAVSPDEGGGPRVQVRKGRTFTTVADFYGIDDPAFRGGARPAFGDVNGDGLADLVVAAGFGGGPRVSVWDGARLGAADRGTLFPDFFLFEQTLRNGVFVAAADLDGDGYAEVVAGGGPGGGPRVFALDGRGLTDGRQVEAANFFAGPQSDRGGVRVAAGDYDGDGLADILTGSGAGSGGRVARYAADATATADAETDPLGSISFGVFVG